MEIIQELIRGFGGVWSGVVIAIFAYTIPYFIAKGFYEGKYSSVDKKKVCDICWRDINKVNDCLKKQSK